MRLPKRGSVCGLVDMCIGIGNVYERQINLDWLDSSDNSKQNMIAYHSPRWASPQVDDLKMNTFASRYPAISMQIIDWYGWYYRLVPGLLTCIITLYNYDPRSLRGTVTKSQIVLSVSLNWEITTIFAEYQNLRPDIRLKWLCIDV